ncbi:hypothetical protein Fot_10736 [Forsythia ovata]|uniref:Uncharacterized protein n=1 Tax=Forsythia ovata TaxID=205694 RepID=A0ABD1WHP8_9LAMI
MEGSFAAFLFNYSDEKSTYSGDIVVSIYIEKVKSNEDNLEYLCNSITEEDAGEFCDRSVTDHTTFGSIDNFLISSFPTIQKMGNDICENVTYGDNIIEETAINVIS